MTPWRQMPFSPRCCMAPKTPVGRAMSCSVSWRSAPATRGFPIACGMRRTPCCAWGFFEPEVLQLLKQTGKPMVLVDQWPMGFAAVNPNNEAGAYLLTRHLLERGHTRIAFSGYVARAFQHPATRPWLSPRLVRGGDPGRPRPGKNRAARYGHGNRDRRVGTATAQLAPTAGCRIRFQRHGGADGHADAAGRRTQCSPATWLS